MKIVSDTTHNHNPLSSTAEYQAWMNARHRCANPSHAAYPNYGGRGIYMWKEWQNDFSRFLADVGVRPSPNYTLERKNNDNGYFPGNVTWATRTEQANNRRERTSYRLLTLEEKNAIRVLHGRITQREIAKIFAVTQTCISIVNSDLPYIRVPTRANRNPRFDDPNDYV